MLLPGSQSPGDRDDCHVMKFPSLHLKSSVSQSRLHANCRSTLRIIRVRDRSAAHCSLDSHAAICSNAVPWRTTARPDPDSGHILTALIELNVYIATVQNLTCGTLQVSLTSGRSH